MRQISSWIALLALAWGVVGGGFEARDALGRGWEASARCQPKTAPDTRAPDGRNRPALTPHPQHVPSPMDGLNVRDLNIGHSLAQLRRFHVVDRFEVPTSGVTVVLRSDGRVEADVAAVDRILHARLRLHSAHADAAERARMRCFKEVIVDRRAFRGTIVNIYVPSDPRMCIKNLRLVTRPEGAAWGRHCHWKGATPPVRFSGLLGEVRLAEYHIVVAPGITGWSNTTPDATLAEILRHEADHLWDWMMDESPLNVLENERRARRGDMLIDRIGRDHGAPLPNPFFYFVSRAV